MDDILREKVIEIHAKIDKVNRRRLMVIVVQAILTMVSVFLFPLTLSVILIILLLFITLFYIVATHKHIEKLIKEIGEVEKDDKKD